MPAKYAKTMTVVSAGANFYAPPPQGSGMIRFHNLDTTNPVWLALGRDTVSAAEGDDSVRIGPGEQYITSWLSRHNLVAVGADVKVLVEAL